LKSLYYDARSEKHQINFNIILQRHVTCGTATNMHKNYKHYRIFVLQKITQKILLLYCLLKRLHESPFRTVSIIWKWQCPILRYYLGSCLLVIC